MNSFGESIDDYETLILMQGVMERKNSPDIDNRVSPELAASLKAAREDIENGNFFTDEEVDRKMEEWLQKGE